MEKDFSIKIAQPGLIDQIALGELMVEAISFSETLCKTTVFVQIDQEQITIHVEGTERTIFDDPAGIIAEQKAEIERLRSEVSRWAEQVQKSPACEAMKEIYTIVNDYFEGNA